MPVARGARARAAPPNTPASREPLGERHRVRRVVRQRGCRGHSYEHPAAARADRSWSLDRQALPEPHQGPGYTKPNRSGARCALPSEALQSTGTRDSSYDHACRGPHCELGELLGSNENSRRECGATGGFYRGSGSCRLRHLRKRAPKLTRQQTRRKGSYQTTRPFAECGNHERSGDHTHFGNDD